METVKWEKWGSYAIKTRGFSISKSRIRDEWLYTLWKLPKAMLGNYGNVDDAKKAHLEIIRNEPTQFDSVDSKFGLSKTLASDYTRIKG
jgi:hypothetical protein